MIVSVDLDDLSSQLPLLAVMRTEAERLGLSRVTAQRYRRKRGVTVRIVFRAPQHRRGDQEISYVFQAGPEGRKR